MTIPPKPSIYQLMEYQEETKRKTQRMESMLPNLSPMLRPLAQEVITLMYQLGELNEFMLDFANHLTSEEYSTHQLERSVWLSKIETKITHLESIINKEPPQ